MQIPLHTVSSPEAYVIVMCASNDVRYIQWASVHLPAMAVTRAWCRMQYA